MVERNLRELEELEAVGAAMASDGAARCNELRTHVERDDQKMDSVFPEIERRETPSLYPSRPSWHPSF